MDLKLEMWTQEQFGELVGLDRPHDCKLCGAAGSKIAIENMRVLSEWWLSPVQRTAWNVETLIQGLQAPTGDIKKSLKDLEREITPLYNRCDGETLPFRAKGVKSISLHERLTNPELQTIQSSLSTFIVEIRNILEANAATGPR